MKNILHTLANYSDEGNHLLFEAQRMVYADGFRSEFPEHYIRTVENMIMFYMNVWKR